MALILHEVERNYKGQQIVFTIYLVTQLLVYNLVTQLLVYNFLCEKNNYFSILLRKYSVVKDKLNI